MTDPLLIDPRAYKTSAQQLPIAKVGSAEVVQTYYSPGLYDLYNMKVDGERHRHFYTTRRLPVRALRIDGQTWMVDDPPHWYAMQEYASEAHGHVLIGGLGLGMIVACLLSPQNWLRWDSVTVIERNQDVCDLIWPHATPEYVGSRKVELVRSDFTEYVKSTDRHFDYVMADLWVAHGIDEVLRLAEEEVGPLAADIHERWPHASMEFHGFGMSWVRPFAQCINDRLSARMAAR